MKFRKKPIVVEAEQWFPGTDVDGVVNVVGATMDPTGVLVNDPNGISHGIIQTLEGPMRCSPGDWVITGIHGEKYACKPDVFAKTYERVYDDGDA
jgi:hypothetical protein